MNDTRIPKRIEVKRSHSKTPVTRSAKQAAHKVSPTHNHSHFSPRLSVLDVCVTSVESRRVHESQRVLECPRLAHRTGSPRDEESRESKPTKQSKVKMTQQRSQRSATHDVVNSRQKSNPDVLSFYTVQPSRPKQCRIMSHSRNPSQSDTRHTHRHRDTHTPPRHTLDKLSQYTQRMISSSRIRPRMTP